MEQNKPHTEIKANDTIYNEKHYANGINIEKLKKFKKFSLILGITQAVMIPVILILWIIFLVELARELTITDSLVGPDLNIVINLLEGVFNSFGPGLIIGTILFGVEIVLAIIWAIKCLTLDEPQLKSEATLWGILGLIILPVVAPFIMSSKVKQLINKNT